MISYSVQFSDQFETMASSQEIESIEVLEDSKEDFIVRYTLNQYTYNNGTQVKTGWMVYTVHLSSAFLE